MVCIWSAFAVWGYGQKSTVCVLYCYTREVGGIDPVLFEDKARGTLQLYSLVFQVPWFFEFAHFTAPRFGGMGNYVIHTLHQAKHWTQDETARNRNRTCGG